MVTMFVIGLTCGLCVGILLAQWAADPFDFSD